MYFPPDVSPFVSLSIGVVFWFLFWLSLLNCTIFLPSCRLIRIVFRSLLLNIALNYVPLVYHPKIRFCQSVYWWSFLNLILTFSLILYNISYIVWAWFVLSLVVWSRISSGILVPLVILVLKRWPKSTLISSYTSCNKKG